MGDRDKRREEGRKIIQKETRINMGVGEGRREASISAGKGREAGFTGEENEGKKG